MTRAEELRRGIALYMRAAKSALRAAKTYRDGHYARDRELARVEEYLSLIDNLVNNHVCCVELRATEKVVDDFLPSREI